MKKLMTLIMVFMFISLPSFADDHPPYVEENDLVSADVLNDWFETFAKGLGEISPTDLLGTWHSLSISGQGSGGWESVNDMYYKLEGEIIFSTDGLDFFCTTSSESPFDPGNPAFEGNYDVVNNLLILSSHTGGQDYYKFQISYINKVKYILYITGSYAGKAYSVGITKMDAPPDTPSYLNISLSDSSAVLSWTDNSDDEDGFIIYRRDSLIGDFVKIGTTSANEAGYIDAPEEAGTYWYRVSSFNENGESLFKSNVEVIKIPE